MPIVAGGDVAAVVYLARTSSSPLEAVWTLRHALALALALCVLLMAAVTFFLSRAISRPVLTITNAAEAIAHGESPRSFDVDGLVPAEVEALSRSLQRMTAQLTERSRYIRDFTANVSHELKTPLAGMRGAIELLREQSDEMSEAERRRFLDNIDADVGRTERLVTRLLQLARIQSSTEAPERVQLKPFFEHLAERYDGRVNVDLSATPETIDVNPDHLETAVHNLVDNAVRHGGDKPVDVSVSKRDGKLVVRVRDHGKGISERNRARVFDRFFTTERDRGGTGLGLAIVRAVAETRGGSVTFETGDEGTTFTLVV
jgi:signal transduction histidine kinase